MKWNYLFIFLLGILYVYPSTQCLAGEKNDSLVSVTDLTSMVKDSVVQNLAPQLKEIAQTHTQILTNQDHMMYACWVLAVVVVVCSFFLYKKLDSLKSMFHLKLLADSEKKILTATRDVLPMPENSGPQKMRKEPTVENKVAPFTETPAVRPQREAENVKSSRATVKYASMQQDSEGRLRIADRVMVDSPSNMLFKVEIDTGTHATYTINNSEKNSILSDLQTFSNFVAPFTLSGGMPKDVQVSEKGELIREGKFWVVTKKLVVVFTY